MENAHSILAPSSGHIWGAENGCTAWVKMAQMYPEPDEPDKDKDEGTASHEVGEQLIREALDFSFTPLDVGSVATNGTTIDEEMVENAEVYATSVIELYNTGNRKDRQVAVEHKGPITRIHPECFGTKDFWMWDPATNTLYIYDYKYGHRFVEVFEWIQGILYAAGLLVQLKLPLDCKVVFRIVQPRSYSPEGPIQEWSVNMSALLPHFDRLAKKAEYAINGATLMQTGPHCKDCYPRFACQPALNAGIGLYELATKQITHNMSNGALGLQLSIIDRAMEQMKSLRSAFAGRAEAKTRKGESVPGWGTAQTIGKEVWTKPIPEVVAMGKLVGVDISKPGAKTPNQSRKLGVPEAILATYSGRSKKGLKLVKDDGLKARKAFTYNKGE